MPPVRGRFPLRRNPDPEEKGTASGEAGWYWSPERVVSGSAYEGGRTGTKGTKDRESVKRCRESMGRYGLGEDTEELYPFELSGE